MTTTQYPSAIAAGGRGRPDCGPTSEDLEMIDRTRGARDLLSAKWKVDLLYLLARGIRRYSRLYDNLRGASKKMLTDSADEHMPDVEEARGRYDEAGRQVPVATARIRSLPAVA